MKKYTFELIINEGNDEFWEALEDTSGCDEITNEIKIALDSYGFDDNDIQLKLTKYENV